VHYIIDSRSFWLYGSRTMTIKNIVQAFSEEHIERLTGLTVHQLRYWDSTGFFVPSFASENRREPMSRVYSSKDVVSLRVLSKLKEYGVSLQHLRQVSEKLAHLADEKWTKTTLYVWKKRVLFIDPDDPEKKVSREVVSGQYAIPSIVLAAEISDTQRVVEQFRRRSTNDIGRIEQHRMTAQNAPVIAGTRITVAAIKRFNEAGYSAKQIIEQYPDLTEADIKAALAYREDAAA